MVSTGENQTYFCLLFQYPTCFKKRKKNKKKKKNPRKRWGRNREGWEERIQREGEKEDAGELEDGTFSVQFSSVPWLIELSGGHEGRMSSDPLPVFSGGGPYKQFWHGQGCPHLDDVHPAFPLLTTVSPTLQVPWRMVLERLSWHVTCPNHARFRFLIVARRSFCGPTRKLILLRTQL